jgi:hypothetical protein
MGLRVIVGGSFRRDRPSELHELARAARSGDPAALEAMAALVEGALTREAPELLTARDVALVPMAGHRAATASGPAAQLAERLGAGHPAWRIGVGPVRLADAPLARDADTRDPRAEASTIRWHEVTGDGPVVIVDDVVRSGASLEAAWLAAPPDIRGRLVALVALRAEG